MSTKDTNSLNNAFNEKHNKDKALTQRKRVFKAFFEAPKTMLMVSNETGILRANICRYVRTFRQSDKVAEVKKGLCKISNHRAGYLTTNPDQFPKSNQFKMF
ncbi:hypothetical protein [Psychroflexus planctonicus]|uniref:Uncharacterized protein n=1 Tax=Psychroflexus planctonicus TaxID=1526575 RepID=A0ABQ1SCN9_9FLAO|nr:hypothetical protein [Psychroflexus planctonicus]GGE25572.1 hypothetical protein GCM10010832_02890 [Psychroflexus planctonicus]